MGSNNSVVMDWLSSVTSLKETSQLIQLKILAFITKGIFLPILFSAH